ncbi:MAG: DUF4177 domain-containing protein [Pseudooceanicola sp.]
MTSYEYRVVPAPTRGQKAKGVKGPEGRFATAIEDVMNTMSRDGWEYQRAETLPSEERQGLTHSTTTYRNLLVFRRTRKSDPAPFQPRLLGAEQDHTLALSDQSTDDMDHTQPGADHISADPHDIPAGTATDADPSLTDALRRRAAAIGKAKPAPRHPPADHAPRQARK